YCVELFITQRLHQLTARAFFQPQRHPRISLPERSDHTGNERNIRSSAGVPDCNPSMFPTCSSIRRRNSAIDVCENESGIVEKCTTGIRQFNAARLSLEQKNVKLALKGANLLAQRGLLYAKTFGRPCDVTFFGHGNEISEVPQLHHCHICQIWILISRRLGR